MEGELRVEISLYVKSGSQKDEDNRRMKVECGYSAKLTPLAIMGATEDLITMTELSTFCIFQNYHLYLFILSSALNP